MSTMEIHPVGTRTHAMPRRARTEAVSRPSELSVGGVPVASVTQRQMIERIVAMTSTDTPDILVGVNAHVVNLAQRDAQLRAFLGSTTFNYADGQSVVWASRALGAEFPERIATTDLAPELLTAAAQRGLPVFFLGGAPGVADGAADLMRAHAPGLRIDASHGYFGADDEEAALERIRRHGTRILFVGLGDPLQERWIAKHRDTLPPVVLTCGGLFDWLSGAHRRAPLAMQRAGLEWLWRLAIEPRRLAHRYIIGNPQFVSTVLRQRRTEAGARTRP